MDKNLAVEVSIEINAPAFKVWKAVTDPVEVKKYFFGTQMQSSLVVGEPITFSGEWNGKAYTDKGIVLEMIPEHVLKYSYFSSMSGKEDKPENYADVTYRLQEEGEKTTLTIIQTGAKDEQSKIDSEGNWKFLLDSIKKLVESN